MPDNLQQEILIHVGADTTQLTQAIGDATEQVTNLGTAAGGAGAAATSSFTNFRAAIRAANSEAQQAEMQFGRNSQQFIDAAKNVANLKLQFKQYTSVVEAFNPSNKLAALVGLARGATAGIQGISGAMAFLGGESEKNEEIIRRLQGLMAFSAALGGVEEIKNSFRNLGAVIGLTTTATEGATVATEGFGVALKGIGIGLLIAAVALLVTHWQYLKEAFISTGESAVDLGAINDKAVKQYVQERDKVAGLVSEVQNENTTKQRRLEIIKQLQDISPNYFGNLKTEADLHSKLTESVAKYNQALLISAQIKAAQDLSQKDEEDLVKSQIGRQSLTKLSPAVANIQDLRTQLATLDKNSQAYTQLQYKINGLVAALGINEKETLVYINKNFGSQDAEINRRLKPYQDFIKQKQDELAKLGGSPDGGKPVVAPTKTDNGYNELLNSLKDYYNKVEGIVDNENKTIAKENKSARDGELAAIEEARLERLHELDNQTNDEVKKLSDAHDKKTITTKQYQDDLTKIGAESFKAREAINEASQQQILETNQKYDKQINDYLNKSQEVELDVYSKKKKEINDKINELLVNANDAEKKLLEASRATQLGNVDNIQGLQSISDKANQNLINVQDKNVIGDKDTPQQRYDKEMAVNAAKLNADNAAFDLQKAQLQGNQDEIVKLTQAHNKTLADLDKNNADNAQKLSEATRDAKIKDAETVANALSSVGDLVGQQTVEGKALAIAAATISTYAGAAKAYEQGGIYGYIGAAAVIAAGLAQVKKIIDTKVPTKSGSDVSTALPTAPALNTTLATPVTTQDVRVTNQNQQPTPAYIVQKDLNTNESRNNFLNKYGSF